MSDPRANPEQEEADDGASPSEQLIEACRRNNTDLLLEVISNCGSAAKAATLLNETKTVLGNYLYHEAALQGNYEVIDTLLDQEGFECDPINRREGDTPLHSAVRWLNEQPENEDTLEYGKALINMMIEAGSDARIKNKAGQTALNLTNARNTALRSILESAIYDAQIRAETERQEARDKADLERELLREAKNGGANGIEDAEEPSGSDSDFDIEEFRRERERLKKEAGKGGKGSGVAF